ncbi:MAG: thioredoxin domain-containing protein [Vulcanimicrobiaceae bacterium]
MSDFHFSPRPNRAGEIAWLPWGTEAFERAEREDKPILLAISAVWCHWCHVMDETSYSDAGVLDAIARNYVPVRVDNDRRPDVNVRYNMGGWPTTAFLAPDGTLLTGGTYIPPEQMRRALDDVARFYAANKGEIAQRTAEMRVRPQAPGPRESPDLNAGIVDDVVAGIASGYDEEFGGFGEDQKFPQTDAHELLLARWRTNGDPKLLEIVASTMRAMAGGGTYDRVEGGFFRYSTVRDWSVPHFEKMAEDHGGLLRVLAQLVLWAATDDLRATLAGALGYVRRTLRDSNTNLFGGSQDADERYFALPRSEREKLAPPYVDRTSYSNWTAGLAGAWIWASSALDEPALLAEGLATLDALHERLRDERGLLFHYVTPDGPPEVRGLLTDQVAYLRGLLDAHESSGESRFVERGVALGNAILAHFSAEGGGFYDRAPEHSETELGRLDTRDRPIDQNGALAGALLRLAVIAGDRRYRDAAESTLRLFSGTFATAGSFAANYAHALLRYLEPEVVVKIVGGATATRRFRDAALRLPEPFVNVRTVLPEVSVQLDLPAEPNPAAYACVGTVCAAPVRDPSCLAAALRELAPQ